MKIFLLGNAGSGKSTLAKQLIARDSAALLPLDDVAFVPGTPERRPVTESIRDIRQFMEANERCVLEGCYADLFESLMSECDELIFLNPGVDACVEHSRRRPWEPEKFPSREVQDQYLENLIAWVRTYVTRNDEYGLARHRALFDGFSGHKHEYTHPSQYESL